MLLAVDVGNSLVKLALLDGEGNIVERLSLLTERRKTVDEYISSIAQTELGRKIEGGAVTGAILSSVVYSLTSNFAFLIERMSGIRPFVVGEGCKTGVAIKVEHPAEVGSDLIAVASGAIAKGLLPAFVADLGTANKYIYVGKDASFEGVAIAPGIRSGASSLKENTAALPEASLVVPKSPLGKNTFDSLNSGILYGTAYEARGFLDAYREISGGEMYAYLTGGNARFVKPLLEEGFSYDRDLLMKGLFRIYEKNVRGGK